MVVARSSILETPCFKQPFPNTTNASIHRKLFLVVHTLVALRCAVLSCHAGGSAVPPHYNGWLGSYEALAAMHDKSREDRKNDEAAGLITPTPAGSGAAGGAGGGAGGGGGMDAAAEKAARAERARAARARRLRAKNEPCLLPDRLLHRVRRYCRITPT